jgi:hypothetical protein
VARVNYTVFVDTNVIIEAHRVKVWKRLSSQYNLATAEVCLQETQRGGAQSNPDYVEVPENEARAVVQLFSVTERSRIMTALHPGSNVLDAGEFDLMAQIINEILPGTATPYRICSPDKALMRFAFELGIVDNLVSLEDLIKNPSHPYRRNFTRQWQSEFVTRLKLGVI